MIAIDRTGPLAEDKNDVHVIIDTPRGSRNKLKWDRKLGVLKLSHVLTAGACFLSTSVCARHARGRRRCARRARAF